MPAACRDVVHSSVSPRLVYHDINYFFYHFDIYIVINNNVTPTGFHSDIIHVTFPIIMAPLRGFVPTCTLYFTLPSTQPVPLFFPGAGHPASRCITNFYPIPVW